MQVLLSCTLSCCTPWPAFEFWRETPCPSEARTVPTFLAGDCLSTAPPESAPPESLASSEPHMDIPSWFMLFCISADQQAVFSQHSHKTPCDIFTCHRRARIRQLSSCRPAPTRPTRANAPPAAQNPPAQREARKPRKMRSSTYSAATAVATKAPDLLAQNAAMSKKVATVAARRLAPAEPRRAEMKSSPP